MKCEFLLTMALVSTGVSVPAAAEPLLYKVSTIGSGALNGTVFNNRAVTISLVADPSADIASFGLAPTSQTVTIDTLGTFSFGNQVFFGTTFSNVFYLAGRNTTAFVRDFLDVQLPDYTDIYSPFTPVSGTPTSTGLSQFTGIATSGGALGLTKATSVSVRAVPYVAAVPEPVTWAMMIVGFGLIGLNMRRHETVARGS